MTPTPADPPVTAPGTDAGTPGRTPVTVRGAVIGGARPVVVVPLTAATPDALVAEAGPVVAAAPDVVEWRVDHLADGAPTPADVAATGPALVAALGGLPLLVTVRTAAEGGRAAVDDAAYEALQAAAVDAGVADLLDVEVGRDPAVVARLVERAHAAGVPVVGSSHDFAGTPPRAAIVDRLLGMAALGADVLKVAVMPRDPGDVLTLLAATWEASTRTDRPVITMAMGELGVASRLAGGAFGSAATFGTVGAASAPGQVELGALRAALDLVHPAR
ncbi:type I 3-dehydroquinate dehydratase [Cellulomonas pakistanensis]|uniref:3-dehydroquinate dehydratase n=1 Tax=Cellulomonas pakistanensis TaxID=992287 RepID=A0A919P900_9CELL|nr:type I 3-dehydroquinate dehydratase [Cellulomonas pakistanensis]GIG35313.1 3-dehydroquinate dehydratase [Cellulomonas pakistanensis]